MHAVADFVSDLVGAGRAPGDETERRAVEARLIQLHREVMGFDPADPARRPGSSRLPRKAACEQGMTRAAPGFLRPGDGRQHHQPERDPARSTQARLSPLGALLDELAGHQVSLHAARLEFRQLPLTQSSGPPR